jgi:hypothetical protein
MGVQPTLCLVLPALCDPLRLTLDRVRAGITDHARQVRWHHRGLEATPGRQDLTADLHAIVPRRQAEVTGRLQPRPITAQRRLHVAPLRPTMAPRVRLADPRAVRAVDIREAAEEADIQVAAVAVDTPEAGTAEDADSLATSKHANAACKGGV